MKEKRKEKKRCNRGKVKHKRFPYFNRNPASSQGFYAERCFSVINGTHPTHTGEVN